MFQNPGIANDEGVTNIENGAMRRTTCCEFLGCFRRGMRSGSKSGGKYLLSTMEYVSQRNNETWTIWHTFAFRHGGSKVKEFN